MTVFPLHLKIGSLTLGLDHGDLFEADADAIVNSEQTDFFLSRSRRSISGQIRRRYGDRIQEELDAAVDALADGGHARVDAEWGRPVLDPPVVIRTSGGGQFRAIYHAGFHRPDEWLEGESDDELLDHGNAIQGCVRQVLEQFAASDLASVAFPLLGTGVFGLDPGFMAKWTLDTIARFTRDRDRELDGRTVWIVLSDRADPRPFLQAILESTLNRRAMPVLKGERIDTGVRFLDAVEKEIFTTAEESWCSWLIARYAELFTHLMLSVVALSRDQSPMKVFPTVNSISFERARKALVRLASGRIRADESPWARTFREMLRPRSPERRALAKLVQVRNDVAHGRAVGSPKANWEILQTIIHHTRWQMLVLQNGELDLDALRPWVKPCGNGDYGLFQRWTEEGLHYLEPVSGEVFEKKAV